jgi:hypothetical protein
MAQHDELERDLAAIGRWVEPGAIDLGELSAREIAVLLKSVNTCLTGVISLRVALEGVRQRRRKSH